MKFNKICLVLASAGMLAVAPGCKDFYDVNVNPLNPKVVGLNSLLPVTQVNMAESLGDNVSGMSEYTMALMRQLYTTRSINNYAQTGDSFSGPWGGLYSGMLVNNEQIIKQGTTEGRWDYVGIAQIQKAYVFSQIVDLWGDVPYSEALQGGANPNPRFDKDVDIYNGNGSIQGLFSLIDEGIANLAKPTLPTKPTLAQSDLIYIGQTSKWARFGRTLKLKLYNQIRLTKTNAEIQALVGPLLTADLIEEDGGDFQLAYSNVITPDNRNPGYVNDYTANPENNIGRYFYEGMLQLNDPRIRYYFYRQVLPGVTVTQQDYVSSLDPRFVTVRPGTTSGLGSSATTASVQTIQGLYPVGGKYDTGAGGVVNSTTAKAEAPQRLLTYYARKYIEAELRLTVYNDAAAARTALEMALNASFAKVNAIATVDGSPTIPAANINTYITAALARYDNKTVNGVSVPTTADDKLEVIMYEKYVASYGYGVDIYTDFRRTGHPFIRVSSQAAAASPNTGLLPDDGGTISSGFFPLRLYYPTNDLTLNPNSPRSQRSPIDPIFWDQ